MGNPLPSVQAVLFDAYGTLLDVHSVAQCAEQLFPGHGEPLSRLWRDKQIDVTRLLTLGNRYLPFRDATRAGLRYAAQALRLPWSGEAEDRLMEQYRHLSAFAESRGVLQALRERGIRTGTLSNADPDMLDEALASAGLADLLDPVLSVQAVRRYKTDPAAYAMGPQALQLPAGQILFVSSNGWDAIGATWHGYTTLWVNRTGGPLEPLGTEPTRTGKSLADVLEFFPS